MIDSTQSKPFGPSPYVGLQMTVTAARKGSLVHSSSGNAGTSTAAPAATGQALALSPAQAAAAVVAATAVNQNSRLSLGLGAMFRCDGGGRRRSAGNTPRPPVTGIKRSASVAGVAAPHPATSDATQLDHPASKKACTPQASAEEDARAALALATTRQATAERLAVAARAQLEQAEQDRDNVSRERDHYQKLCRESDHRLAVANSEHRGEMQQLRQLHAQRTLDVVRERNKADERARSLDRELKDCKKELRVVRDAARDDKDSYRRELAKVKREHTAVVEKHAKEMDDATRVRNRAARAAENLKVELDKSHFQHLGTSLERSQLQTRLEAAEAEIARLTAALEKQHKHTNQLCTS